MTIFNKGDTVVTKKELVRVPELRKHSMEGMVVRRVWGGVDVFWYPRPFHRLVMVFGITKSFRVLIANGGWSKRMQPKQLVRVGRRPDGWKRDLLRRQRA